MPNGQKSGDLVAAYSKVVAPGVPGAEGAAPATADEWILAYVVDYDAASKCWIIQDADDPAGGAGGGAGQQKYKVPASCVISLPGPDKTPQKFRKNARVMALYPETTTFYPGNVLQLPKRSAGGGVGAGLQFVQFDGDGDNPPQYIPSRFVFPLNARVQRIQPSALLPV